MGFGLRPHARQEHPFSVEKATKLVTGAGATGLKVNALILPAVDPYPDIGTIVQRQLGKIGIQVTLSRRSFRPRAAEWIKGTADGFITGIRRRHRPIPASMPTPTCTTSADPRCSRRVSPRDHGEGHAGRGKQ